VLPKFRVKVTGMAESTILKADGTVARLIPDPQRFVSDLLRNTPEHHKFSAAAILNEFPELRQSPSCVVDLAYEEFCRKRNAGIPVTISELTAQYSSVRSSLCRVLEFEQILIEHPSLIDSDAAVAWPVVGNRVADCLLLEQIGKGLLSRVFVAQQESFGNRLVVVKVCLRGDQEASLMGRLNHQGICFPLSLTQVPGRSNRVDFENPLSVICMPYLTRATLHHVTELLHGSFVGQPFEVTDVQRIVDELNSAAPHLLAPKSERSAEIDYLSVSLPALICNWFRRLASAVQAAHRSDILHCDIKPGNILVLPDLSVQLLDFNLASAPGNDRSRIAGGTMPYMSPEQLAAFPGDDHNGQSNNCLGPETDVWGLCATLWHFLTGSPPFGFVEESVSRTMAAREMQVRHERGISQSSMSEARALLPPELIDVLLRGLSVGSVYRICTTDDLLAAIDRVEHRIVRRKTRTASSPLKRLAAAIRRPTVSVFLGICCTAVMTKPLYQRHTPARPLTEYMRTAEGLVTSGQFSSAEKILTQGHGDYPSDPDLAGLLGECRLRLGMVHEAHQAVSDLAATSDTMRFFDLYCRSQLLEVPLSPDSDVQAGGGTEHEEQIAAEWMHVMNEWKSLFASDSVGTAARANYVAMCLESFRVQECQAAIAEIGAADKFPSIQRITNALRLHVRGKDRSADLYADLLPMIDCDIRSLSCREAAILATTAAQTLSTSTSVPEHGRRQLDRLVHEIIRQRAPNGLAIRDLKSLMVEPSMMQDKELMRQLGLMLNYPTGRPENCLQHLLVGPDLRNPGDRNAESITVR
jgi:serine/threonine protein kinase